MALLKNLLKKLTNLIKKLLLAMIWFYQRSISPSLPKSCRYIPTCSEYAKQALIKHGLFYGTYLAVRRILSCHPYSPGGYDPVP